MRPAKFNLFRIMQLMLLMITILDQIENVLSKRRDGQCDKHEFTCENGDCISDLFLCDGYDTCGDNSDESEEICLTRRCDIHQFRCFTGQCIKANWVCDGLDFVPNCFRHS